MENRYLTDGEVSVRQYDTENAGMGLGKRLIIWTGIAATAIIPSIDSVDLSEQKTHVQPNSSYEMHVDQGESVQSHIERLAEQHPDISQRDIRATVNRASKQDLKYMAKLGL